MTECLIESSAEVAVDLNEKKLIRVLHVDDEPSLLKIAKQCLKMRGPFQVDSASSVEEALEKLKKKSYDAVVSDYPMPGKDGLEFLKELKQNGNIVPFMLFTGKGREEVAIKALNLGAEGYLNKTGDPETVYGELAHGIRLSVEEKRAKEKINALTMEKELILQSTTEGIFGLDESGKIRFANDSAQRMLGWKESELLGKSSHKTFYHTGIDGKPISKEECPSFQVLKNGCAQKRFSEILWRKDGSSFPVEYAVSPIWKKGKIAGTVEFFLDITERKKAEEELLYKDSLLENVSNAIIATDLNFGIKSWNKAAEEIYGWTEEEAIGKKLKNVTGIEYLHMNEEQVVERFSKEARWEYEVIEKRKNGSSINVFASVSLIKDRTGNPIGLVAVNRDITERKKMEETLLASLDRYRSFIEVAGELGWTTNADGEVVEDVPSFRKFTGQTYEEVKGWGWSKALHPDDLERTTRIWKEATRTKSKYEVEYRLRGHDGVYRYFMARGVPVFKEDGNIREWVGTCIDITERKKAEEPFRKSVDTRASGCQQSIS